MISTGYVDVVEGNLSRVIKRNIPDIGFQKLSIDEKLYCIENGEARKHRVVTIIVNTYTC